MHRLFMVMAATIFIGNPSHAAVVAESLPYVGTPDWSDVVPATGMMVLSGSTTTMTTIPGGGVWFGNYSAYNPPGWSIAGNAQGNYLAMTARFSLDAADWSAYMSDGTRYAAMIFNPTGCDSYIQSCYPFPARPGVELYFGGLTPGSGYTQFVDLDSTQYATYEWLLLGDNVTYRINGRSYSDRSIPTGASQLLIIGDGSATNLTGTGAMQISRVSFDAAPAFSTLPDTVPEPASWTMLIAGFGLVSAVMRRRRSRFA